MVAVYNDTIAYEETLGDALKTLFGKEIGDLAHIGEVDADTSSEDDGSNDQAESGASSESVASQDELIKKANEAFNNAVTSQKAGDWASYGDYLKELQNYLTQLEKSADTE